eukprot:4896854-Amphidinium_carterae.1
MSSLQEPKQLIERQCALNHIRLPARCTQCSTTCVDGVASLEGNFTILGCLSVCCIISAVILMCREQMKETQRGLTSPTQVLPCHRRVGTARRVELESEPPQNHPPCKRGKQHKQ